MEQPDQELERLLHMHGSDEGFYLLAVHSFVEAWLRNELPGSSDTTPLPQLVDRFRERVLEIAPEASSRGTTRRTAEGEIRRDLRCLGEFVRGQFLANSVRHRFVRVDREEVRAVTSRLIQFCRLARIEAPQTISALSESVEKVWIGRNTPLDEMKELRRVGFGLLKAQQENKDLNRQIIELQESERAERAAAAERARLERELESARKRADSKDSRVDELRHKLAEYRDQQRSLQHTVSRLEPARRYLSNLARMTSYARTRIDYERELTRLTSEQQHAVEFINLEHDHLIKGAAGTGKTLVLLKALERATRGRDGEGNELELEGSRPSVSLLTYTRTLVKYDRYIASLLDPSEPDRDISTVDRFIAERLKECSVSLEVDYSCMEEFAAVEAKSCEMEPHELATEIEDFLFAGLVTREEYVRKLIPRHGRRGRLRREAREAVWAARERIIEKMLASGRISKNYSRVLLLEKMGDTRITSRDFVFVDEVQDLAACDLTVLKRCARRALIMAGDNDQAIYGPGFSFRRAGVEVSGRTRILRTNFRNSIQIHEIAERFRFTGSGTEGSRERESQPVAYRFGPPPELVELGTRTDLRNALLERIHILVDALEYDPSNICVICPSTVELENVQMLLEHEGYEAVDLRSRSFRFSDSDAIRLSTLHSSKGLDFPVVLIYLPDLLRADRSYDEETGAAIIRHLLYVCMTRAMEQLCLLLLSRETGDDSLLADLRHAFNAPLPDDAPPVIQSPPS